MHPPRESQINNPAVLKLHPHLAGLIALLLSNTLCSTRTSSLFKIIFPVILGRMTGWGGERPYICGFPYIILSPLSGLLSPMKYYWMRTP